MKRLYKAVKECCYKLHSEISFRKKQVQDEMFVGYEIKGGGGAGSSSEKKSNTLTQLLSSFSLVKSHGLKEFLNLCPCLYYVAKKFQRG